MVLVPLISAYGMYNIILRMFPKVECYLYSGETSAKPPGKALSVSFLPYLDALY